MLIALTASAQGPNGSGTYYRNADGLTGQALKTALYNIIKNPNVTSYDGLKEAYKKTDMRPDGKLRDWYSNITNYTWNDFGKNQKEGAGWNREHSVPQSWFNGGKPTSDVVQVIPTDCYVNGQRGNHPLGEVGSVGWSSANSYSKLGTARSGLGFSGKVFEPNDEIKGDMARIYFYMATCYQDECSSWGHSVFGGTTYLPFEQWALDMLMRWSKQDPVDEVETARNNAVYQVQQNRNPFVDYPGLEDFVWGEKSSVPFSYDNYTSNPTFVSAPLFSPQGGTFNDFVEVTISVSDPHATIYYTTDGQAPTPSATRYEAPVMITETTTLKAVAVKDDMMSAQTSATFYIRTSGNTEEEEGTIALCNALFGTSYNGTIEKSDDNDLVGTQDGITVTYSLSAGSYRYLNDSQLRLYAGNTLTLASTKGHFSQITFELAQSSTKTLMADSGNMDELTWTGDAQTVTFSVDGGSGHMRLTKAVVTTNSSTPNSIGSTTAAAAPAVVCDLQGRRVKQVHRRGLYICNGRKIVVR